MRHVGSASLQGVHAGRLLQLHAPEAHFQRAAAGAVRAPAQEVSTCRPLPTLSGVQSSSLGGAWPRRGSHCLGCSMYFRARNVLFKEYPPHTSSCEPFVRERGDR